MLMALIIHNVNPCNSGLVPPGQKGKGAPQVTIQAAHNHSGEPFGSDG